MQPQKQSIRSTFSELHFRAVLPKVFLRNKLQPAAVLPYLANTANSTYGALVLGVIFASVEGADFKC